MHLFTSSIGGAALLSLLFLTSAYTAPVSNEANRVIDSFKAPDTTSVVNGVPRRLMVRGPSLSATERLEVLADKPDRDLVNMIQDQVDDDEYRKLFTEATAIAKGEKSVSPKAQAQAERLLKISVEEGRYPRVAIALSRGVDAETLARVGLRQEPTIDLHGKTIGT